MKKIIILVLILFPILIHAQLQPKASVSYGYYGIEIHPNNSDLMAYYRLPNFMFRTGLEYTYKRVSAYYDTKIWCYADKRAFSPQQASFEFGIKYNITKKIKIIYSHICLHPILTNNKSGNFYGGKDEITLSYGY